MSQRTGQITVIGIGNWGSSLAAALADARLLQTRVHVLSKDGRFRRGHDLDAPVLWLCVPDAAIVATTRWITEQRSDLRGQLVVQSSGALDRGVLRLAESAGAWTASVHPMMSFPTRRRVSVDGVRFAVEAAEPGTRRWLFALVRKLGGRPFAIGGENKPLYHAAAMFASPLLVAAFSAGVAALHESGVPKAEAQAMLGAMAARTMENVERRGVQRSFSGPLARGDAETVKLHRRALAGHPLVARAYDALAQLAADSLPSADRAAIRKALGSSSHRRGQ